MATGGLIEGIVKCYTGKNILKKHLFLYILSIIVTFPFMIAYENTNGNDAEVYRYILSNPIFLIITIAFFIVYGLYFMKFLQNAIKLFIWQDTQKDQQRVKAMTIMPEINTDIFRNWIDVIKFWAIWFINLIILLMIIIFFCSIPVINLFFIPVALVIFICFYYSIPYIVAGFARNYKLKGNISPSPLFTLVPKTFVSATILGLKYFVFSICISILQVLVILTISSIIGILGLANFTFIMAIVVAIAVYIELIAILVFYYAIANIYYRKIELEKEI